MIGAFGYAEPLLFPFPAVAMDCLASFFELSGEFFGLRYSSSLKLGRNGIIILTSSCFEEFVLHWTTRRHHHHSPTAFILPSFLFFVFSPHCVQFKWPSLHDRSEVLGLFGAPPPESRICGLRVLLSFFRYIFNFHI